jgi:hypothetical protein
MKTDPTTQANYTEIASEHIALEWAVDFDKNIIAGSVVHTLRVKEDGVKEVMCVYSLLKQSRIGLSFWEMIILALIRAIWTSAMLKSGARRLRCIVYCFFTHD